MSINELTAVLTHRDSAYAFAIVGITLMLAFLYAFNFTTLFGAIAS